MTARVPSFEELRASIVGIDGRIPTPFGERLLVYCDYTASGRCVQFIEDHLLALQRHYANTHTEDDITGRTMTHLLGAARSRVKRAVNAGPDGRVLACGTGATGAIHHLQQILGVAVAPRLRERLRTWATEQLGAERARDLERHVEAHRPVVFVGPYEHHSNEVSWREGVCEVVEVGLADDGGPDLADLEAKLVDPRYAERLKIGSFSAASNVTGTVTPVHDVARVLHRHGAIACFDYAASAPYEPIDMEPGDDDDGGDPSLDAIFLSPHKFLGGPGSCGLLVFKASLYRADLPPAVAGGGTVDYVSAEGHDFVPDIEERESAGTPGVLQMLKASLALELKEAVGTERIQQREEAMLDRALSRWESVDSLELLGHPHPRPQISIVSFNVNTPQGYLHPKLVTRLLNDLFGIQSRAGCSCAGPYGHRLLHIDAARSADYRARIQSGHRGIKPGWVRVGFHYVMDDTEVDYIVDAVEFVARHGARFLPLYRFDLATGTWSHRDEVPTRDDGSLQAALQGVRVRDTALPPEERSRIYRHHLEHARALAECLPDPGESDPLPEELEPLRFFRLWGSV